MATERWRRVAKARDPKRIEEAVAGRTLETITAVCGEARTGRFESTSCRPKTTGLVCILGVKLETVRPPKVDHGDRGWGWNIYVLCLHTA